MRKEISDILTDPSGNQPILFSAKNKTGKDKVWQHVSDILKKTG
jgi:hypothetical protein